MDLLAEEVEEDVGVGLSVGVVCKKYEEPESCGSAADFLLGEEMKGDSPGREEVEGVALMAFFYHSNDSNKCLFSSPIDVSPRTVNDPQVDVDVGVKSTAVVDDAQLDDDHLAAGDVVSAAAVGVTQLVEDALAAVDVDIAVDDVQVFEAIDPADDDLFSSPIDVSPPTVNDPQVDVDVGVKSTAVVDDAQLDDDHLAAGDVVSAAAVGVTQLVEDALAAVDVDIAVDDVQVFEAIDPADDDQVEDELSVEKHPPVKKTMPKRKHKFGKGSKRGGDRKSCRPVDPTALVDPAALVAMERPTATAAVPVKRMNKKQLHRSLTCTMKKLICAKKKATTTAKKLSATKAQCTLLAKIARDRRKESNLAHQNAESEVNALRDEMAVAKTLCDDAVAVTRKQHAKELLLKEKECDIAVDGMKRRLQSTLKRNNKKSSVVLKKQAAKSRVIIAKSRVIIKRYKMDNARSKATMCNLEEKVAAFEDTLEQLKRSHENAMIDLTATHRRRVRSIHSRHFNSLTTEKQKLRVRIADARQLQNSLYDEVLDTRQHARDACKSARSLDKLSSQRLISMKGWRSKCSQIADNQDELVNRLRDMEVMEEQLQEYSNINATLQNTIDEMTPTMTIGKRWVKNQDKRGGHMEWAIEVDKLVMELLANRCPPTSIQACILVMARSLSPGRDIVRELPCLRSIRNMRTVVLRVTKTLAAFRIGKSPKWTQLHTDETSRRQISLVNVVVGLLGSDGVLKSICLSGSIIAKDSTAENQSRAIIASFSESAKLLHDWIKVTEEMFPDREDLIDLIPKPSSMCVSKLLNGMVSTDTCNTAQLTRSTVIEHIYQICREKGMSEKDLTILQGE